MVTVRLATSAAAMALVALMFGCAATASGPVEAEYVKGDLTATLPATTEQVVAAARQVMADLAMRDVEAKATKTESMVTARTAKDKRVHIQVARQSARSSHVSVRVGVFGDEEISRDILTRIEAKL